MAKSEALIELEKQYANFGSSKIEFIANVVFDLTTYSEELDRALVERIMTALDCIYNKTAYQLKGQQLVEHITSINLGETIAFLDWGINIQGAWIDHEMEEKYLAIKTFLFVQP